MPPSRNDSVRTAQSHQHTDPSRKGVLTSCLPIIVNTGNGNKLRKRTANASTTTLATKRTSFSPSTFFKSSVQLQRSESRAKPEVDGSNDEIEKPDLVWHGRGVAPTRWEGFTRDDHMWFADGQCLVFFQERGMRSPPTPYWRLYLDPIASSGVPFLTALVHASKLPAHSDAESRYPGTLKPSSLQAFKRRSMGLLPVMKSFSPLKFPGINEEPTSPNKRISWKDKRKTWMGNDKKQSWMNDDQRWSDFLRTGIEPIEVKQPDVNVSHELWFAVPATLDQKQSHQYKLAVRNVLALLHGKPLVGDDFVGMLLALQDLLIGFANSKNEDAISQAILRIVTYIQEIKLDDGRNQSEAALNVLAWAEQPCVQWELGYLEAFVHAVGMMNSGMTFSLSSSKLSQVTKLNLQNAHRALTLVVSEVEEKLATFDFAEMWTINKAYCNPAKKSFEAFRKLLTDFYANQYGSWPPPLESDDARWLTRDIVRRLEGDMGALYDFLVDTDLYWERLRAAYRRDWEIICLDTTRDFCADLPRVPVTDILTAFDEHHGLGHIPCPYPLLPADEKAPKRKASGSSIFSSFLKTPTVVKNEKDRLSVSVAYSKATNMTKPIIFSEDNALLTAFQAHEESTIVSDCTLSEARVGRWLLLYGILQVLSQLSVDVHGLQYKDGVRYFLCGSISGCPPWRQMYPTNDGSKAVVTTTSTTDRPPMQDADQTGSHCSTTLERMEEAQNWHDRAGARSHKRAKSSLSTFSALPPDKPLPSLPSHGPPSQRYSGTTAQQVSGSTQVTSPTSPSSSTPSQGYHGPGPSQSIYEHDNGPIEEERGRQRIRSDATGASSAWTDMDFDSSARPSMSTIRESSAQALPMQRGRLTTIGSGGSSGSNRTTRVTEVGNGEDICVGAHARNKSSAAMSKQSSFIEDFEGRHQHEGAEQSEIAQEPVLPMTPVTEAKDRGF